jgi:hypothetical protein
LVEGVNLFNAGAYWESHEAWEKVWQRHQEPWRYFVQGLIQAAAAHHQLRRGIRHGAIKHLRNALAKLDAAPDDFAGLALGRFRDYLHRLLAEIESETGAEQLTNFEKAVEPIEWLLSPPAPPNTR